MTNLVASPGLTPVPQLETTTVALGGAGQIMNAQAQALLNQMAYTQAQVTSLLVMTAPGDLIAGGTAGAASKLGIGASGQVLTVVAGMPTWSNPATSAVTSFNGRTGAIIPQSGDYTFAQIASKPTTLAGYGITDSIANPMTTLGDLIAGGTAGAVTRLPVGANAQVLTIVAGAPAWANSASGFANPMTTAGDLINGGASGVAGRLGIGSNGQILTVIAGAPAWSSAPVTSAFGRTGAVTAQSGDYTFAQIASTPTTLAGYGITDGVKLNNTSQWTKNQSVAQVTLTFAATVTPDASASNNFALTLTGACTLANPTNLVAGMTLNFCIDQDSTGGRVLTLGNLYKFPGGVVPTWATGASAKNFFSAYYDGTILRCSGGAGYA